MALKPYEPRPIVVDGPVARDSLTQAEYEAFKAVLPTWRDRLIAMVLRNTGLRINELLALEIRHCNLAGPDFFFHTRRSKKRGPAEWDPVFLNPGLGVQLRDYIKGNAFVASDRLFGNRPNERDPRRITARGLRFIFDKTGRAALGRPIRPKDFRTFFVQTMVDGGVPMAMASKMVGHEDIRTTQSHYYRLSADRRRVIGEGIPV